MLKRLPFFAASLEMHEGARLKNAFDFHGQLDRWQAGDELAGNSIFSDVHSELEAIAAARLRDEGGVSLSSGDLVNEAVLKLSSLNRIEWQSRPHFLALASRLMRQILIDHARKKNAAKRDYQAVTLCTEMCGVDRPVELMELDRALTRLAELDSTRADIVEMRFFGGMVTSDIAKVLGISERTAERRWASARAWLFDRLKD